jgi:aryl-alcohol dehydrogenase-like predicted oxidoreductase
MKYKRFIDASGGWAVNFKISLKTLQKVRAIKAIHCSIANVASRYMLEQPAVGGVIIGARLGNE